MKEIINNYLTDYYFINKSSIGNYGIYKYDDDRPIKVPIDGDDLINEIKTIFSLNTDEAFYFIHHWTQKNENICFDFFWRTNLEFLNFNETSSFISNIEKILDKPITHYTRYLKLIKK